MFGIMNKTTRHNSFGMVLYLLIAMLFGGGIALLAMIVHEDNDRCHYYHGEWNRGDLLRGCVAVAVGMALRYWMKGGAGWM